MLAEVEKDTSTRVTMNPSIQAKVVYDMHIPPVMANPALQVLVTSPAKTTIVSDSQMLPLAQSNA